MAHDVKVLLTKSEGPYQPVKCPAVGLVARSELALQLISDLWGVLKCNPTFEIQVEEGMIDFQTSSHKYLQRQLQTFKTPISKALGKKKASEPMPLRPHQFEVFEATYTEESDDSLINVTGPDGEKSNLRDIITNLNKCQFLDQNCKKTVQNLSDEEKELMDQVTMLELKHEQGYLKFKQMQEMWANIEKFYHDKLKTTTGRQAIILEQINALNESIDKYRYILKMNEEHLNDLNKLHEENMENMKITEDKFKAHCEEIKKLKEKKAKLIIKKANTEDEIITIQTEFDYQRQIHEAQMTALSEQLQKAVTNRDTRSAEMENEISAARNALADAARQQLKEQLRAEHLKTEISEVEASINILSSAMEQNDKKFQEKIDKIAQEDVKMNTHLNKLWSKNTKTDGDSSCTDIVYCSSHNNICNDIKQNLLAGIYESMKTILKDAASQHLVIKKLNQMLLKEIMTSEDMSIDSSTKEVLKQILINIMNQNYKKFVSSGISKIIFEPEIQYPNTTYEAPPTSLCSRNENENCTVQQKHSSDCIPHPPVEGLDLVFMQDGLNSQAAINTSSSMRQRTASTNSLRKASVRMNFAEVSQTKSKGAAHGPNNPLSTLPPRRQPLSPIRERGYSTIGDSGPVQQLFGRNLRKGNNCTDRNITTYGVKVPPVIRVDLDRSRYAKSNNVPIKRRTVEPYIPFNFGKVLQIKRNKF